MLCRNHLWRWPSAVKRLSAARAVAEHREQMQLKQANDLRNKRLGAQGEERLTRHHVRHRRHRDGEVVSEAGPGLTLVVGEPQVLVVPFGPQESGPYPSDDARLKFALIVSPAR